MCRAWWGLSCSWREGVAGTFGWLVSCRENESGVCSGLGLEYHDQIRTFNPLQQLLTIDEKPLVCFFVVVTAPMELSEAFQDCLLRVERDVYVSQVAEGSLPQRMKCTSGTHGVPGANEQVLSQELLVHLHGSDGFSLSQHEAPHSPVIEVKQVDIGSEYVQAISQCGCLHVDLTAYHRKTKCGALADWTACTVPVVWVSHVD
jgi:hypothetical protein